MTIRAARARCSAGAVKSITSFRARCGGADDVRNLWPEPYYNGTWTATIKDKLEARAHKDVCNPLVSDEDRETLLAKFRRGFMRDWEQLYLQYYPAP